jgi:hypothetical protein
MDERTRQHWAAVKNVPANTITDEAIERWVAEMRTAFSAEWRITEGQNNITAKDVERPKTHILPIRLAMLIIDLLMLFFGIITFAATDLSTHNAQLSILYGLTTVTVALTGKSIILLIDSIFNKEVKL